MKLSINIRISTAAIFLLFLTGCSTKTDNWTVFNPPHTNYTIELPGEPKYDDDKNDSFNIHTVSFKQETDKEHEYLYFLVQYTTYGDDFYEFFAYRHEFFFRQNIDPVLEEQHYKLVSEKPDSFSIYSGKLVTALKDDRKTVMIMKIIVVENQSYRFLVYFDKGKEKETEKSVNRFFNSFKLKSI